MRALIVSDVHSNLEAFQSVIDDAEARGGFDQVWSLGDLVGYGPDPSACIDLLRQYDHRAVAGNHDLASVGKLSLEAFNPHAAAANRWTAAQLSPEQTDYLGGLELKLELDEFTVVHGSPRDPIWEYVVSVAAAVASFLHFDTYWCLLGHSHIPFVCRPAEAGAVFLDFPLDAPVALSDERVIINPGGVGQPRDGDPRASYAIYDSDAATVAHHRVEYDIPATQEKMRRHDLPQLLIDRLSEGL
ncbi:MAG: metallophosphoesterase family protein [Chloroflexi bacterium]|nr:metallophosphoesterase family protein [Chloroflexota bacterium]